MLLINAIRINLNSFKDCLFLILALEINYIKMKILMF